MFGLGTLHPPRAHALAPGPYTHPKVKEKRVREMIPVQEQEDEKDEVKGLEKREKL